MRFGPKKTIDTDGKPLANPWWLILLTAPVPLVLFTFFFYKWYQQRTDFTRISQQYMDRQNRMLSRDAAEVAQGVADLLEKAARDVRILSLVGRTLQNYRKFYFAQGGDYIHFANPDQAGTSSSLVFYNRILFMTPDGSIPLHLYKGQVSTVNTIQKCLTKDLCDHDLLERARSFDPGQIEYGSVMRWYTPQGWTGEEDGAGLAIAFRGEQGIFLLSIDYRHIRDHITTPVFPYVPKRNLLQAYENGNYTYIVDARTNLIAHPKMWHAYGLSAETGLLVPPMKNDTEEGNHPIRISVYQEGKLKVYFDRLLKKSFPSKRVDVFQATNLTGTSRVISVAPIPLDIGQYKKTGVFGYVVVGCAVEYFEEPKERAAPYY